MTEVQGHGTFIHTQIMEVWGSPHAVPHLPMYMYLHHMLFANEGTGCVYVVWCGWYVRGRRGKPKPLQPTLAISRSSKHPTLNFTLRIMFTKFTTTLGECFFPEGF